MDAQVINNSPIAPFRSCQISIHLVMECRIESLDRGFEIKSPAASCCCNNEYQRVRMAVCHAAAGYEEWPMVLSGEFHSMHFHGFAVTMPSVGNMFTNFVTNENEKAGFLQVLTYFKSTDKTF